MRSLLATALLSLALTAAALADPLTLYGNGIPSGTASANSGLQIIDTTYVGDDFLLSSASTVTGAQFHGFAFAGAAPVTGLRYYFYTATGSLPGTLLDSGAASNLSLAADGLLNGYLANFDLAHSLTLDAGRYFLVLGQAVSGSQVLDSAKTIAAGTSSGVFSISSSGAPGTFDSTGEDYAFSVLGNPVITAVPEPSSFVLSGSMLSGLLLIVRRRGGR